VIVGGALLWGITQIDISRLFSPVSPPQSVLKTAIKPAPTPPVTAAQTSSSVSPDGKLQVTMQSQKNDSLFTYTFFVGQATESGQLREPFLTKTTPIENAFAVPFNTFSPDKKYFFLEEKETDEPHFLVFAVSTKPFRDGEQFIDVTAKFKAYTSTYTLFNITGWADEQLLIIQTKKADQSTGPSFWFEVGSQAFIQLSTRF
jgi:hypothetical protein